MAPSLRIGTLVALLSGFASATAWAGDVAGAKDHPLAGRFEGSTIVDYKARSFDEAALLRAPIDYAALLDRNAPEERSGPEWLAVQGKLTEIRYDIPEHRSSLEVMVNYQSFLKSNGFEIQFNCADSACLKGNVRDPYVLGQLIDTRNGVSTSYFDHARYLLAVVDRSGAPAYVAVITGEDKERTTAFVRVVETKAAELDKIKLVTASEMKQAMDRAGRVQLYGIQFDFDKATIKPESRPTLAEIAKVISDNPGLKLEIVGHTDDKGKDAYNLALSNRRAASVVSDLQGSFGVARSRLTSRGAGVSQPLVPNDSDANRAKNRRVELIVK
ncbi:outer membrane protein OmpA-like peptidoglycan-associated protein [Methylobacterium brachythecii]|nr:OmpA family protein [Methylobacterium brachythecii]MBB3901184.1 outer membrane protein OmpA-like peptidoglycan-associated protein [Methylobacterium brachythecii]